MRPPLLRDESGNIAIIFALMTIPLIGLTGAALDYGIATRLKTQLAAATDATALMLCQTPTTTTTAQLQSQAQQALTSFMSGSSGVSVDTLGVTSSPRQITLTARAVSETYFSKFTGLKTLPLAVTARCATPMPKTFEIALVLDTTGSMAKSDGSGSKLSSAQTAATKFIDYVKTNPAFSADTRLSIVPFAASVAVDPAAYADAQWIDQAGASAFHWNNINKSEAATAGFTNRLHIFKKLATYNSNFSWKGCFEALPYPANVQDVAPSSDDTKYVPLFAPDEPGSGTTGAQSFWDSATGKYHYTFNSYMNDGAGTSSCPTAASSFQAAESRACKYANPVGISYTADGPAGIPNGPNFSCTSKPLQRLTTSTSTLKNLVSSLQASGATNIHQGLMWGWRTLSPNGIFQDGTAYSSKTTSKVIVLMTDGANSWSPNPYNNYNYSLYFPMGYFRNADGSSPNPRLPTGYTNVTNAADARVALDQLTLQACNNAKAAGVSIYTIGFSVSTDPIDTQGTDMLKSCASSSAQAFVANDSSSLIAAFDQIGKKIGSVRLTY